MSLSKDQMVAGIISLLTQVERIYLTFVDIKLVRHSAVHNRTGQILPQMALFPASHTLLQIGRGRRVDKNDQRSFMNQTQLHPTVLDTLLQ